MEIGKKARFSFIYFLLAIAAIILLQRYFLVREVATIGYSEFKALLNEGLVEDLRVSKENIEGRLLDKAHERIAGLRGEKDEMAVGRLKEFRYFKVVRMEDPDLTRELVGKGMRFTAKPEATWLKTLLSWVVPMLLLFVVWGYFFRKVGGVGEGLMAVGRSKAKVYVEGETKVTFGDVAGVEEAKRSWRR